MVVSVRSHDLPLIGFEIMRSWPTRVPLPHPPREAAKVERCAARRCELAEQRRPKPKKTTVVAGVGEHVDGLLLELSVRGLKHLRPESSAAHEPALDHRWTTELQCALRPPTQMRRGDSPAPGMLA